MNIDSKNEINLFEGYKSNKISKDDNGKWLTRSNSFQLQLVSDTFTELPIGRQQWKSGDQHCKEEGINPITFSRCEFGEEYTCTSGHCIDIKKKCDGNIDCDDRSDENHCSLVKIPKSYKITQPPDTNILTRIWIQDIHNIDTKNMQIESGKAGTLY